MASWVIHDGSIVTYELFGKSSRVIERNTSHDIHDSPVDFVRPIHQTFTNILTSSQSVQIFLTTISLIYPHVSCLACSGGSAISQSLMKSVCSKQDSLGNMWIHYYIVMVTSFMKCLHRLPQSWTMQSLMMYQLLHTSCQDSPQRKERSAGSETPPTKEIVSQLGERKDWVAQKQ